MKIIKNLYWNFPKSTTAKHSANSDHCGCRGLFRSLGEKQSGTDQNPIHTQGSGRGIEPESTELKGRDLNHWDNLSLTVHVQCSLLSNITITNPFPYMAEDLITLRVW